MNMEKSVIQLFKALPITKSSKKKSSKELLKKTISYGFIFSPEVVFNYSEKELIDLVEVIASEVGLSANEMNNSFHKSWKKIQNAPTEQLVLEQIIHYITTYGFEALGVYDKDTVYIPVEKLEIPKIDVDKIKLSVIKGYTKKELKTKLIDLLATGIALKEETKNAILEVIDFVKFYKEDISEIKNKEVKCVLYDILDIVPEQPVEFLRYLLYKATGKTLIIKNGALIAEIKSSGNKDTVKLLNKYNKNYGLERLAEIFYRFKPLFLAFKRTKESNSIINKIRKLAVKHHKPMKEDYLNEVTAKLKLGKAVTSKELKEELTKVNIFRKIRLAYALKFRTTENDSILYRIRNGKSFATSFNFNEQEKALRIFNVVLDSITKDIKKNIEGKTIYLPKNITYTLPATEKQFTGNLPSGSYVTVPSNLILGVHWDNVSDHRIDLDLALLYCGGKIGWDASYRSESCETLFSGDMTDAKLPHGATELFYIQKQKDSAYLLSLNYFNYEESIPVPFKILIASDLVKNFSRNYMVDPNKVIVINKSIMDVKQKVLGLLVTSEKENKFYFTETGLGNQISSSNSEYTKQARKYLFNFYENAISLNDLLISAGAKIVENKEKADIDLSVESLEKDTILKLLVKNG